MTGAFSLGPAPAPRPVPSVAELIDFEARLARTGVTSPGRRAEAIADHFGMRHVHYEQRLTRVLGDESSRRVALEHDPLTTNALIARRDAAKTSRADLTRASR